MSDWILPTILRASRTERATPQGCTRICRDRYGETCGYCDAEKDGFVEAVEKVALRITLDPAMLICTLLQNVTADPPTMALIADAIAMDCSLRQDVREAIAKAPDIIAEAEQIVMAENPNREPGYLKDCA
jgi:hypothetical protein